jgi:hypothetical protein
VDFNYLLVISSGSQTVAVSDFIYRPFNRSIMSGTSRTYLQYFSAQRWIAGKRLWRASPLQIYPETPVKLHHILWQQMKYTFLIKLLHRLNLKEILLLEKNIFSHHLKPLKNFRPKSFCNLSHR